MQKSLSMIRLYKLATRCMARWDKKEQEAVRAFLSYVFEHKNDEI